MNNLRQKLILALVIFIFAITSFHTHVYSDSINAADLTGAKEEVWELQLKGEWKAKFKVVFKKASPEKDVFILSGKFAGKIDDSQWGNLDTRLKLEGKSENNSFVAVLSGHVAGTESTAASYSGLVKGKFKGTLSNSQGSGTYEIIHNWGAPGGEWTLKKI